jgi:threonine dehydratase
MIAAETIHEARARIAPWVRRTPVIELEPGAFACPGRLTLKLELTQHTGSFKPRGAFNRVLSAAQIPEPGIIAASGGNHGAAVAYVAQRLGLRAEIFVPSISSPVKVERIRGYGAAVTVDGGDYIEALALSSARAKQTGALVVHAYDQPEVVAGQATCGLEFDEQAPGLDTVLVAVGGGGLIAGIAAWYAGRAKIVAVEPELAPCLHDALTAGRIVETRPSGIAADSLGARSVGPLAFDIARRYVDSAVLVTDDAIRGAQQALWETLRIMAEPGGAAALSAILSGAYKPAAGERVGVLVCGGNAQLVK